jgi:hypothetical protein
MFPFHQRLLQYLACYLWWSCQLALVGSTVWLPYLLDMFLLIYIIIIIIIISSYYHHHNLLETDYHINVINKSINRMIVKGAD